MDMQQRQMTRPVGLPILRSGIHLGPNPMPFDPTIYREWLNAFLAWAAPHGIATRCPPTANTAGRLDIGTAQVIARITYWSSGECDAEILEVESEQRIYQCSWTNLQPEHFDTAFAQWLAIVHGPTAQSLPP
ncbi:TPA: hypothetical protein ACKP7U_004074 [Stenotrophomonas maltophilia]